ncbi:EAL and GGDEF domain-containing protein [Arenimonas sp.]|uniref:sensor domain-containing protein n=1 Tax=Arenimonas sp. TaxID=1872635 RepID=UPI0039E378B1
MNGDDARDGGDSGSAGRAAAQRAEAALNELRNSLASGQFPARQSEQLAAALAAMDSLLQQVEAERLRADGLFNALPDPVSIIDQEGRILDLNAAGLEAYGRPRGDIVGRLVHVLNPDLPRDHMSPVWEVLNRGESYVIEVTNMRADGSRFPVEVHSAVFDDRGERHIVAVARDLSSRVEAELRYQQLMESIDKGILVQDKAGRILSGNPAALRMFGIEHGDRLADALRFERWLVVDERGKQIHFEDMPPMRALRHGQTVESTLLGLYHRHSKQLSWLSVTSVPQYAPDNTEPHQVISIFSDVTVLKRDSALFDRAQTLARIGGWEWDAPRQKLYLTDEALRIIGRVDDPPRDLSEILTQISLHDRPHVEEAVARLFREGGSFDLEVYGQRPDGEVLWARLIGEAERSDPEVTRLTGTLQDITARKMEEERLRVLARTDPLTGLLNRDGMMAALQSRLGFAGRQLALFYIDLDRFKMVNDVLGHSAGDQILIGAAQRLTEAAGPDAVLARFGGDEFLALCDFDEDSEAPEEIAERITQAFGEGFRIAEEEFSLTASVGLACSPQDGERPEQLLNNADAAMYDAKRRGRNTWQRFNPRLARRQQDRLQIESQLRRAMDNNEFHLVYQPQVSLRDGRIYGAEALLRWRHRSLGELSPDAFINQAEATGDIVRIGAWVIGQACHQICAWRKAGLSIERVAVNVSSRQILGDELPRVVEAALGKCGLPGSVLELEMTERVLVEDAPDTVASFDALRSLGVGLVIDDFGEGYSALNYLRRLPINGLKLSRPFLQGVPDNHSDVAICQAVAGIAHSLGLSICAEGVETEEQRRFLMDLGVSLGQGFLYSPGISPEELTNLMIRTK